MAKEGNFSKFSPQKSCFYIGYPISYRISDNTGIKFQYFTVPTDPTTLLFYHFFHGFCKKLRFGAKQSKKIRKYNLRCSNLSSEWGAAVVERINVKGRYPMKTLRHIGKGTKWNTEEKDKVC